MVRRDTIPTSLENAYVHVTFREHTRINAWGVGPSTPTIRQFEYHAQTDDQGFFGFPPVSTRYWDPLLFGRHHYISGPIIRTVAEEPGAFIVNLTPKEYASHVREGTTFHNQPYLISTNSVFVGKGKTKMKESANQEVEAIRR